LGRVRIIGSHKYSTLRRHSPPGQRMVGPGREADIRTASQVKLRGSRSLAPKNPAGAGAMRRSAAWAPDVLGRINGHPASRLDELLPWNWKGRSARLVA
jgi:hypothetical protein